MRNELRPWEAQPLWTRQLKNHFNFRSTLPNQKSTPVRTVSFPMVHYILLQNRSLTAAEDWSYLKYWNVPEKVLMPASKASPFLPPVQQICSSLSSMWTSPKGMLLKTTNKTLTLATFVWREWIWEGIRWGWRVLTFFLCPQYVSKRSGLPLPAVKCMKKFALINISDFLSKLGNAASDLQWAGGGRRLRFKSQLWHRL